MDEKNGSLNYVLYSIDIIYFFVSSKNRVSKGYFINLSEYEKILKLTLKETFTLLSIYGTQSY